MFRFCTRFRLNYISGQPYFKSLSTDVPNIYKLRSKLSKTFENPTPEYVWFATTKKGLYIRLGLIAASILFYPIYQYLRDGLLIDYTFRRRYKVTDQLPETIKNIIEEAYLHFIQKQEILPEDAKVKFTINENTDNLDTVAVGAVSARTGAWIALPFYVQFDSFCEAYEYCTQKLEKFNFLGHTIQVDWDSQIGQELISTFVLTPKAKKFLISRDLVANDDNLNVIAQGYHWATYSGCVGISAFFFSKLFKRFKYSPKNFVLFLLLGNATFSKYGAAENYKAYRYLNDHHGDEESARNSLAHCEGGKEYYMKMLKRNRLFTKLLGDKGSLTTPVGDIIGIPTSIFGRYDSLKDLIATEEEIALSVQGDDF